MKDYSNFKPVAVKGEVPKLSDKQLTTISDNELEVYLVSSQIQIRQLEQKQKKEEVRAQRLKALSAA